MPELDRHWLLTWTTYGTWLPGDRRGFVSEHRDEHGEKVLHNRPDEPYDIDDPELRRYADFRMTGDAVWLDAGHARALLEQFEETASHRRWSLLAGAIMSNHVHLVVSVPNDPDPESLLRDFKSYGSRRLNREFQKPASGTWWTASGSRRKLAFESSVLAAIAYVERQRTPLVVWSATRASGGCEPPGYAIQQDTVASADRSASASACPSKPPERETGRLTPAAHRDARLDVDSERVADANPAGSHRPLACDDGNDWKPAIGLERLRLRTAVMDVVRKFFAERGYLEVDTPILSHDVVVDAHLDPFVTRYRPEPGLERDELFLQTSPEFHMKRMLAAMVDEPDSPVGIWQSSRVMRQGELGRWHEPEFVMLEWYGLGDTHVEQMRFTEELVVAAFAAVSGSGPLESPFERLSYDAAFERFAGTRVLEFGGPELAELATARNVSSPAGLGDDRDGWLNLLLTTLVEPHLGTGGRPTFLYDYPASQAALARIRAGRPDRAATAVAERFELYVDGLELANGYHELTDAAELRERIEREQRTRVREGLRELPAESRLLEAMEAGLPNCSGVALGFDRLLAIAVGAASLGEVVPFPFDRS